jgi:tRNA A-37 threonylcarbamoyl transferase component Bud32
MSPGGGTETIINVTGTLQMVIKFRTEKTFRIKEFQVQLVLLEEKQV